MKTKFTLLTLLISIITIAQNGINYKALIKDTNGNVLASSPISIQFIIYEGSALTNNVYQESHTINTDVNGFVMVNIGEGTTGDDFNTVGWGNDEHYLNVQVNIGSGLVDLGTTQFMAVPYALNAANVSGLEKITENDGVDDNTGWRLIGSNPDNYGAIGEFALDLSTNPVDFQSTTYGATGFYSFAAGALVTASGTGSIAMGTETISSGFNSTAIGPVATASAIYTTAIGIETIASGNSSTAIGRGSIARSKNEMAVGSYNTDYTPNSVEHWNPNDRVFVIGNGDLIGNRSNALTILKNGNIGIGTDNPQELLHLDGILRIGDETIRDAGNDALRINAALLPDFDDTNVLGNPSQRWRTVYAVNGTINTSDRREKKNIQALNYGLNEVLQMQPVSFNWKNTNSPDTKLGLIAQDLQTLIPEVVMSHTWEKDKTGQLTKKDLERLGVYYSDLVPVLIKAIQEQNEIINNQNEKISKQDRKFEALLSRIEQLEAKKSN